MQTQGANKKVEHRCLFRYKYCKEVRWFIAKTISRNQVQGQAALLFLHGFHRLDFKLILFIQNLALRENQTIAFVQLNSDLKSKRTGLLLMKQTFTWPDF